ncbi:MAG: sulfatase [Planctomycetota bacterium]|nr:MAG: sulfatase [Planctomycetota bacterium]
MKYYWGRRQFLKTVGLGAASLVASRFAFAQQHPGQSRNVLLYVVDDHGTDDAGCYGNPVIKTPGLDALARKGTRFTHAFCTTASCSASRSVILTGLHNHATGQYGHQHGYNHFVSFPHIKSLPVLLAGAGYRTASAGKYHVAPEEVYRFQQYIKANGRSPAQLADDCKQFIAAQDDSPFFLYFCTTEPHRPFRREGSDTFDPKDVIAPRYLPDTPACREELAKYYGSVQRADKGLLRLIEILKQTGRWNDTLILYISDNGIAFPGAKTTLYDPGMRLPCVVRNPYASKKGIVTDAMITWADVTPTILDFAGALPDKPEFHGRSFLPVLEQQHPQGWDEIYASHTFHEITMYYPMRVVRTRRHKLIWNIAHKLDCPFASDLYASATWQDILKRGETVYGKRTVDAYIHRPKFELYDLQNDPHEINNLADDPDYIETLEKLKRKLARFQERTKDPWVLKWKYE